MSELPDSYFYIYQSRIFKFLSHIQIYISNNTKQIKQSIINHCIKLRFNFHFRIATIS